MSTNANPVGETERIDASEATGTGPGGVPLTNFAGFSIDISDEYTREETIDNNLVDFDALLVPSGEFSVYPNSDASPQMVQTILNRTIDGVYFGFPTNDARSPFAATGARFDNVSQEELSKDGYQMTGEWTAGFITSY